MTPVEQGRFCNNCKKTVVDFTAFTDAQLLSFFSDRSKQVCGRFYNLQLNIPVFVPPQPHSRLYRYFIGLGLTLLFTQIPQSNLRAQAPYADSAISKTGMSDQRSTIKSFQISGHVTDEHKEPMVGAYVSLYKDSHQIVQVFTDKDGFFKMDINDSLATAFPFELTTRYSSYLSQKTIVASMKSTHNCNIKMNPYISLGLTEIIEIKYKIPLIDPFEPNKTVITSEDIERMAH